MEKALKNKGGWIEIVEAFTAILLIAGVILIILNKGSFQKSDISDSVYNTEVSILREIETNDSLRAEILGVAGNMPVPWNDSRFPLDIKNKIISRTPASLICIGQLCDMNQVCSAQNLPSTNIYSQAVTISSTLQELEYRKLNLFCWTK